jgi:molybdate transport system ATP-binding protein
MLEIDLHLRAGDFELDVQCSLPGPATGIFGPSGAGKTTILHCLAGLTMPESGRIVLDGEVLFDSHRGIFVPPNKRRIGVVFQDIRLFPHYSVRGNLQYGESLTPRKKRRLHLDEVAEMLEIGRLLDRSPRDLSGGERQRVALGRAILCSPRLLLMDEPLASLDQSLRQEVLPYLRRLRESTRIPLIFVSHNLSEVLCLVDEILLLRQGRAIGWGRFLDLLEDPECLSAMHAQGLINVIPCIVKEHRADDGMTLFACLSDRGGDGAGPVPIPAGSPMGQRDPKPNHAKNWNGAGEIILKGPLRQDLPLGSEINVLLRPQDIALALKDVLHISMQNHLPGRIGRVLQLSGRTMCLVDAGVKLLAEVTNQVQSDLEFVEGKRVWCLFKAHGVGLAAPSRRPSVVDRGSAVSAPDTEKGTAASGVKTLERRSPGKKPASRISYFQKIVETGFRAGELRVFAGKVVGTFCNFVPEELILAAGAVPVRLCAGDCRAEKQAEDIFPRDTCPVVKSALGLAKSGQGFWPRLDMVVIPAVCNAKKKLAEALSPFVPTHVMQVPASKTAPGAREMWLHSVRIFQERLEALTGKEITPEKLRTAIVLLNERQKAFWEFFQLRRLRPSVITGVEALMVTGASFYDNPARWTNETFALCEKLKADYDEGRGVRPAGAPRILLTGAPLIYPNFKLAEILESARAVIAIDEMCSGTQRLCDPAAPKRWSMHEMRVAVADKYLQPSICPCFVEGADRVKRLLELVDEFAIDGVVYHNLRMCPLQDVESFSIKAVLAKRSIPLLVVQTDYGQEDVSQLRTRVDAFLEIISGPPMPKRACQL